MRLDDILLKIEDSKENIIEDMIEMIRIPAIGPANGGDGEGARADRIMGFLKGFDTIERIDVDDTDYPGVKRPSILAKKIGKRNGTVWIVAHIDTVLPGNLDDWDTPPYEPRFEDGRIYGLGTEDNGQAVMAAIYAARYFEDSVLNGRSIGIALVSDEETTSEMGIGYLVQNDYFNEDDFIVVPDWGSPGSALIDVAEKHLLWVKFSVKGKQTHGSTPEKGINAYRVSTMMLADLLERLDERYGKRDPLFKPPISTFEPTKRPGTVGNINTIPGYDEFWMDCRILPDIDPEDVLDLMRSVITEHSERTGAEILLDVEQLTLSGPSSSTETSEYRRFAESIKDITGIDVEPSGIGGGTCANFFRLAGLNAYVWESEGGNLHQPNEYVKIDSIITDAKVYATLFHKLCVDGS